jgi:hypothetical protein
LEGDYERLYQRRPDQWGDVLSRYAIFQRLRRRESESEADHRGRQARWLRERRRQEKDISLIVDDVRTNRLHDDEADGAFFALGTWIAEPGQYAGSELENWVHTSPTGRVLVLDIASDKDRLVARISELIDRERVAAGIPAVRRRGRQTRAAEIKLAALWHVRRKAYDLARQQVGLQPGPPYPDVDRRPEPDNTEYGEFLRSVRQHQIVPLWDLQLAGLATDKLASARMLYPERTNPARPVSQRSIPRGLLQNIERARELQDQAVRWVPRLRAVVG